MANAALLAEFCNDCVGLFHSRCLRNSTEMGETQKSPKKMWKRRGGTSGSGGGRLLPRAAFAEATVVGGSMAVRQEVVGLRQTMQRRNVAAVVRTAKDMVVVWRSRNCLKLRWLC